MSEHAPQTPPPESRRTPGDPSRADEPQARTAPPASFLSDAAAAGNEAGGACARPAARPPAAAAATPYDEHAVRSIAGFERWLRLRGLSEQTVEAYTQAARQFLAFAARSGMPTALEAVSREHVEEWLLDLRERVSSGTELTRYRGLRRYFAWALDVDEIRVSPMERIHPPKHVDQPVPSLRMEDLARLLAAHDDASTEFERIRNTALLRVFMDTGLRLGELSGLRYRDPAAVALPGFERPDPGDVDLEQGLLTVTGKGGRRRTVPIGARASASLTRYLAARRAHRHAPEPWLWLAKRGRFTASGVRQMVSKRARRAGLGRVWPHMLRHSFADAWLRAGGSALDLQELGGWTSPAMVSRYTRTRAAERAHDAHRLISPGDQLKEAN